MVIETGISDFHKMCITVMKMYHSKQKPPIIHYCKFKDFNNDAFIKDLKTLLSKSFNEETIPFQALRESMNETLEKRAPSKTRYTRASQAPYMNKKLSKEIMKRSRLSNKFLNTKSDLEPFLTEKSKKVSKITLIEDNQIISQDKQIAKIFNECFISIPILNMPTNQEFEYSDSPAEDPLISKPS